MQFVKQNWLSLVSAVVVLGALGWAYVGLGSTAVRDEMTQRAAVANQVGSIEPRNEAMIAAEKASAEKFVSEYGKVLEVAERTNKRDPLMEGAFPRPAQAFTPYEFKEKYINALRDMTTQLSGGDIPNQDERNDAKEEIEEILLRKKAEGDEGKTEDAVKPERGGNPRFPNRGSSAASDSDDPLMKDELRAAIQKARSIRCYVSLEISRPSFHVHPLIERQTAPVPDEMWEAQAALWIQQDVVAAIKDVNDAAAEALKDAVASVENMPVKRLESIRVAGYWGSGGISFPLESLGATALPAQPPPSFTNKVSDDKFDVIRFAVMLVVDQRELMRVIDAICSKNFYQLIGAEINPVSQHAQYYYGPQPLWSVTLYFEGYMSRKAYVPLMPDAVRVALGIQTEAKK